MVGPLRKEIRPLRKEIPKDAEPVQNKTDSRPVSDHGLLTFVTDEHRLACHTGCNSIFFWIYREKRQRKKLVTSKQHYCPA